MFNQVQISEDKRTMFRIPLVNFGKFAAEIEKLSRRSVRAGGSEITLLRFGTLEDKNTGAKTFEVFLDVGEFVLDGYTFAARLDHSQETGNIIRMMPNTGIELPESYSTVAPNCDHCKINRMRRDTFVLRNNEDGSFVQVGSSCMQEFFKSDPRGIARLAEIIGYAREAAEAAQQDDYSRDGIAPTRLKDLRYISMEDYLLHCAAVVRVSGRYRQSSFREDSTKTQALSSLYRWNSYSMLPLVPTEEDHASVAEAMEWIDRLAACRDAGENLNNYENNVLVVGQALVIEGRSAGIAASIIGCYKRNQPKPVAPKVEPKVINIGDMSAINQLFSTAGQKLKWPKITISFEDVGEIVLSVAGNSAQFPGSINVTSTGGFGNNTWYGRVHKDGRFEANRRIPVAEALEKALHAFAADPAGVAAAYGHRTGNCFACSRPLSVERSTELGYGKVCAKNWGLPYPTAKEAQAMMLAA